ncbi:MAG: UPF0262 family protein [Alphaproteobacteria bacterium]
MSDQRIVHIELDRKTLVSRSAEVEHERAAAIYDLLEANHFAPVGDFDGPYRVRMRVEDANRLVIDISNTLGVALASISMSLMPFRRIIRDYFKICESYFDAIKRLSPSQIETIDMARRGLHNEGSEFLMERLEGKAVMDRDTARRLFTLLCVLHFRG